MHYCITHTASDFLKIDFQAILLVLLPLSTLLPEITGTADSWASWRILWYKLVAFLLSQNSSLGVWFFRSAKSLTTDPKASQVPKFFAVISCSPCPSWTKKLKTIAFLLEAARVSMLNLPLYLRISASITGEKQYLSMILIYIFHIVSILESPFYFAFKTSKYFLLDKYSFSHWTAKVFFFLIYKSSLYLRNQLSVI